VKKSVIVLVVAILLPLSALSGKKKRQDSTDWLNAPTPDGSPTLKQTSDWLAKTLQDYGGLPPNEELTGVRIDNDCTFNYDQDELISRQHLSFSIPLGAITNVEIGHYDTSGGVPHVELQTGQVADVVRRSSYQYNRKKPSEEAVNEDSIELGKMPRRRPGGELPQTPEQIAPRVVSAFQHAVNLCQSGYKAPAQSKEPF
jgi:hypothetical protein